MRKGILFFVLFAVVAVSAMAEKFTSCGPGYVLVESRKNIDDIPAAECQKLWCRDLETGKPMGKDNRANSGYQMSADVMRLCDAGKPTPKCIECWGERKWCSGEPRGEWILSMVRIHVVVTMIRHISRTKKAVALHGVWKSQSVKMVSLRF